MTRSWSIFIAFAFVATNIIPVFLLHRHYLHGNTEVSNAVVSTKSSTRTAKIVINVLVQIGYEPGKLVHLVESLLAADYMGSTGVSLEFHVEGSPSEELFSYLSSIEWRHGLMTTHAQVMRAHHGGYEQFLIESWFPESDEEFSVLLNDDSHVKFQNDK